MPQQIARTLIIVVVVLLLLSAKVVPGFADASPPPLPPGSNIGPDGQTQVRMMEEHVSIDLVPVDLHNPERYPSYVAYVEADFSMMNLGETSETMNVRFPLSYVYAHEDLLIDDFQVWAEWKPVPFETKEYPNDEFRGEMKLWAEFPVTFLPKQEVLIQVQYTLQSVEAYGNDCIVYVFETGAGWNGTIGKAELIVNLPYEYSLESILSILPGGETFGKAMRWTWQDFEPTAKDKFYIGLVSPETWKAVIDARQAIEDHPEDGAVYTKLGALYAGIAVGRWEIDYPAYKELAIATLKKGAELSPEDPEPHHVLFDLYYTEFSPFIFTEQEMSYQDCSLVIDEMNQTLMRANLNDHPYRSFEDDIQLVYDKIMCSNKPALTDQRNVFPTLTVTANQSPTVDPYAMTATAPPTLTVRPTSTPWPTKTLSPSETPTRSPSPVIFSTATPTHTISPTPTSVQKESAADDDPWGLGVVITFSLMAGGLTYIYGRSRQN